MGTKMKKEKHIGVQDNNKVRCGFFVVLILLACLPIFIQLPQVTGDSTPYPLLGLVTSCDDTLSYVGATVTVLNPRTGVVRYDTVSSEGYFLVTFGNFMGPDEWFHGDSLRVWVNGTGDYAGWQGSLVTQFDKNKIPPHRVNITLCYNDTIPPETNHLIEGLLGYHEWYVSNVSVTLNASDDFSGVLSIYYKIDTASFHNYSSPFTLTGEGIKTITYFSVDRAGNNETMKTIDIKIDKTVPETGCVLTPSSPQGTNGWYTSSVNVLLTPNDKTSGVNMTWYRLNKKEWQGYGDSLHLEMDGTHTMEYYSCDYAGNRETTRSLNIKIDTQHPYITLKKPLKNTLYILDRELIHLPFRTVIIGKITLETQVSDNPSGIEKVLFYVDDTLHYTDTHEPYDWIYNEKTQFSPYHTVMIKAVDMAGNTTETDTQDIFYFNI
jgi:hypothetical protein